MVLLDPSVDLGLCGIGLVLIIMSGLVMEEVVLEDVNPGGGVMVERKHRRDWSPWTEYRNSWPFGQRTTTLTLGYSVRKTMTTSWCWSNWCLLAIREVKARGLLEISVGEFMVERHWRVW